MSWGQDTLADDFAAGVFLEEGVTRVALYYCVAVGKAYYLGCQRTALGLLRHVAYKGSRGGEMFLYTLAKLLVVLQVLLIAVGQVEEYDFQDILGINQ